MKELNILITEPHVYIEESISILEGIGNLTSKRMSRKELLSSIADFDIIMVGVETSLDRKLLEKAKRLKIIGSPTTGLDHIDLQYANERGISVVSLRGERAFLENVNATVEHTFALLLSLLRKIPWAFDAVRQKKWTRGNFFGAELNGKTLGIIGYGRIGAKVGKIASIFGMRVIVYDPHIEEKGGSVRFVEFNTLLEESDVISIHTHLTSETENMITGNEFESMRKRPVLINTARGKIVNEKDLLHALEKGLILGAAVDVLSNELDDEPLRNNRLVSYARKNDNLLLTPHLGGATYESMRMTQIYICKKIKKLLSARSVIFKSRHTGKIKSKK